MQERSKWLSCRTTPEHPRPPSPSRAIFIRRWETGVANCLFTPIADGGISGMLETTGQRRADRVEGLVRRVKAHGIATQLYNTPVL